MTGAVRLARAADLDAVVRVLTGAFTRDPMMMWVWPDEATRVRRLEGLWRFLAGEGYLPRRASTLTQGGDGAALWLRPGELLDDAFWHARGGAFVAALEGDFARLSALNAAMSQHHPTASHWYLQAIGVAPSGQGGGVGGALLAHTLADADDQGAPAYLEASSERSRALYERFGFVASAEVTVDDSPPVWPMWREPTAST